MYVDTIKLNTGSIRQTYVLLNTLVNKITTYESTEGCNPTHCNLYTVIRTGVNDVFLVKDLPFNV